MTRRDIFRLFAGSATIPAVKSVESLKMEKDDIIVLKFPHCISVNTHRYIMEEWNKNFPGIRVIIIDPP